MNWAEKLPVKWKKKVKYWFGKTRDGYIRGFPTHFEGYIDELGTKLPKIYGTWKQKYSLYKDLYRRIMNKTLVETDSKDIKHYTPIYMLTKLKSWSNPELGEKDRIIFNNSHKNGGKISLNEGISEENRRMNYPVILQTIHNKVTRAVDLYGECSVACFDVQNGFENLFNNPSEQKLLGVFSFMISVSDYS